MQEPDREGRRPSGDLLGKSALPLLASPARLPIEPVRAVVLRASSATLAAAGGALAVIESLANMPAGDGPNG